MQPINYTLDVKNPFETSLRGIETGFALSGAIDKQQAQQQANQRQEMLNEAYANFQSKPFEQRTFADYEQLAMLTPKDQQESILKNWEARGKSVQQAELKSMAQVLSALQISPEVGARLLRERAAGAKNSGDTVQADLLESVAKMAEIDPKKASEFISISAAHLPGAGEYFNAAGDYAKLMRENELHPYALGKASADVRNIESLITDRSARLSLDRDKLQSDVEMKLSELGQTGGKLDADARKIVNDATIAAVGSEQSAGRMLDLAGRIESAQGGKGLGTKATQWFASATGRQDEWTLMRQEYTRLRNTQAIKALPPGPATDKDIQMALKGFPEETANAQAIGSFLRGMAKLQQFEAAAKSAEAEWVNSTGSLGRAKADIDIGGIQVPAGTTFVDFMRQYGEQRAQGLAAQQANVVTGQRGYMRFANPQTGK